MVGAITDGHIPVRKNLGFIRDNKKLIINSAESEIVMRIFDLYLKGSSYQKIANILNEEKVLNKKWYDTTIQKILANQLYKGNFISGGRTGNPVLYENVKEAIFDKEYVKVKKDTFDSMNKVIEQTKKVMEMQPKNQKVYNEVDEYAKSYKYLEKENNNIKKEVKYLKLKIKS